MALDDELMEIAKPVRVLRYLTPINETEAKKEFAENKSPTLVYRELDYDPLLTSEKLLSLVIPEELDARLKQIYSEVIDSVVLENHLILHRDNPEIVRETSRRLFGRVREDVVETASKIILKYEEKDEKRNITSEEMKSELERTISDLGIEGFKIEFDDKVRAITVTPSEKKATIPSDKLYTLSEYNRLPVHEIGTHMVRAHNGSMQPFNIFQTGLPSYETTEEGLAVFSELITGKLDVNALRNYAGRVLAVQSVEENLSLRETYEMLIDYGLNEDTALTTTIRAHRSGGLIKDHIYLTGFKDVTEYAERGVDLELLYVGKIGLENTEVISGLMYDKIIVPPTIIPVHITNYVERKKLTSLLLN